MTLMNIAFQMGTPNTHTHTLSSEETLASRNPGQGSRYLFCLGGGALRRICFGSLVTEWREAHLLL